MSKPTLKVERLEIILTNEQYEIIEPLFRQAEKYVENTGKRGLVVGQFYEYVHNDGAMAELAFLNNKNIIKLGNKIISQAEKDTP